MVIRIAVDVRMLYFGRYKRITRNRLTSGLIIDKLVLVMEVSMIVLHSAQGDGRICQNIDHQIFKCVTSWKYMQRFGRWVIKHM